MKVLAKSLCLFKQWDAGIASLALGLMVLIPVIEVMIRPLQGSGIDNAPVLVQHLGLIFSLAGAVYAERTGHITSLGALWRELTNPSLRQIARAWVYLCSSLVCGVLALGCYELVLSELDQKLCAYVFWHQVANGYKMMNLSPGLRKRIQEWCCIR
jgi:TRAP-type C4-dicarboxylate transport system permease small subunit